MKLIISPRAVIMIVPKFCVRNCHRMVFYALIASLKHSVKKFDSKFGYSHNHCPRAGIMVIISPRAGIMVIISPRAGVM